jgi:hypothetical protein
MSHDGPVDERDAQFSDWDDRLWRAAMRRFGWAFRALPYLVLGYLPILALTAAGTVLDRDSRVSMEIFSIGVALFVVLAGPIIALGACLLFLVAVYRLLLVFSSMAMAVLGSGPRDEFDRKPGPAQEPGTLWDPWLDRS